MPSSTNSRTLRVTNRIRVIIITMAASKNNTFGLFSFSAVVGRIEMIGVSLPFSPGGCQRKFIQNNGLISAVYVEVIPILFFDFAFAAGIPTFYTAAPAV